LIQVRKASSISAWMSKREEEGLKDIQAEGKVCSGRDCLRGGKIHGGKTSNIEGGGMGVTFTTSKGNGDVQTQN